MRKQLIAMLLSAACAASALAGYVQHVPVDVSDSRQNFPLRVARGEVVELSVDYFDEGEPLDISGSEVVLHTRTNGMSQAESWQTPGTATNNSALFVLDVDAVLPAPSGEWSCVATRGGRTLARLGGPAYVRGTAAASAAALPQDALAGYATTGYVARAVADAEPGDYPAVSNAAMRAVQVETDPTVPSWAKSETPPVTVETDPVFRAWLPTNSYLKVEADPTVPSWAKAAQPPAVVETDPVFRAWLPTNSYLKAELDPTVPAWAKAAQPPAVVETDPVFVAVSNRFLTAHQSLAPATNYTDAVAARKQDRLPYATNAIPQSAVSGLTSALNGKIDQNNGVAYGVFRVDTGYGTIAIRDAAGDPVIDVDNHSLFLPTNKDGTFALKADIPSTNGFIKAESDPTVPLWAKAAQPPAETDPTVPAWAKAANPPSLAEHDPHVALTNGTIYIHGQSITPAAGGRADVASTNAVRYATGVLSLAITSGATLAADLTGWPDGDAVFCHLQAAGAYSTAPSLRLLGYGFWPTNSADVVFARSGSRVLASVLLEE